MLVWVGNAPYRLLYLNTWSPVGSVVWDSYGTLRGFILPYWRKYVFNTLAPLALLSFYVSCVEMEVGLPAVCSCSPCLFCYCHVFPAKMDSSPLEMEAKVNSFFLELLLAMVFCHSNRKVTNTIVSLHSGGLKGEKSSF